jgi:hypothetical protein
MRSHPLPVRAGFKRGVPHGVSAAVKGDNLFPKNVFLVFIWAMI